MLLHRVKTLSDSPLDIRVDDPALFALAAFGEDERVKFLKLVAEFEVVLLTNTCLVLIVVLLNKMVS